MEPSTSHSAIVVTTGYPSPGDPYRNMFVHTRVKQYLRHGLDICVVVIDNTVDEPETRELDGVTVRAGNAAHAASVIAERQPAAVLVHFISAGWFRTIRPVLGATRVIVWLHGFEAEGWHRRWYNALGSYRDLQNFVTRRTTSFAARRDFFRELVAANDLDIRFVAVSELFFQRILAVDAGIPADRCTVIHNPIDPGLFAYRPKEAEDRLRILTIRPFTSAYYGNDLVVRAILHLRASPVFGQLHFTIVGEGPLFEELVRPLRDLPNVVLVDRMLEPGEIVEQHAMHGIFLSPGRGDSQGVSRCEAMSSGLVPVASAVSAVPEFVADGETGLLAFPEDWKGLAERIERLAADPELFLRLSAQAAEAVRRQCGPEATIAKEVALIGGAGLPTVATSGHALSREQTLEAGLEDLDEEFARALRGVSVELQSRERRIASLERELATSEETSDRRRRSFVKARERVRLLEVTLARRTANLDGARSALEGARSEIASARAELDGLAAELEAERSMTPLSRARRGVARRLRKDPLRDR